MSPAIHTETPADYGAIREVNRLAFGRDDEARLVDALRHGGYATVSLVAELDEKGEVLDDLERKIREGPVTFIFAAKDEAHNSAVVLKEYLERASR